VDKDREMQELSRSNYGKARAFSVLQNYEKS
jgi:hypothetical protein